MAGLGDRIRSARVGAGLSQGKLAEAIGVDRQAVSLWESDKHAPKGDNLVALAGACGVALEELTQGSARLEPPASAPALKTWVSQRMASVNQGLNEYLETVIEAEVERRLKERLAEVPVRRSAAPRFRLVTPDDPDYGWLSAKLESIGVPKVAAGVPAPIIAEQDVTTQEWWSDPRNLKTMQRDREEARAEATGWLVDRIAIADQRVEEAVAKTPEAGAATPDGEHPPQHPAAGRRTRRPGR